MAAAIRTASILLGTCFSSRVDTTAAWPPGDEETMKIRPAHEPSGFQLAIPFRAALAGLRVSGRLV
jgi:hypothetical protein